MTIAVAIYAFQGALYHAGASPAIAYGIDPATAPIIIGGSAAAAYWTARQTWRGVGVALAFVVLAAGALRSTPTLRPCASCSTDSDRNPHPLALDRPRRGKGGKLGSPRLAKPFWRAPLLQPRSGIVALPGTVLTVTLTCIILSFVMRYRVGVITMNNAAANTRKWWALGALTLSVLAIGMDATILSVALPTLATALHASESDLQWFLAGYMLVLAAAMLPAGLLGDRYGRKKVMLGSLALFAAGSAACAYAPSPSAFIAARTVLGAAGAGVIVMALSALTVLFSEDERPRAVGVWAAANFLAMPIGPLLGGWLLTHAWWGWVFLINVPVALLGLGAGAFLVPESRAKVRPGIDTLGILASTAGLAALTYGLIGAGRQGWAAASAILPMLGGIVLLVGFWLWERHLTRRHSQPLIDAQLFRSRSYRWGVLLQAVGVLAMLGALFILPQYFQAVLGTSAMGSGLRLLPLILGLVIGAVPADRIAARFGAKLTTASGFTLLATGLALGAATALSSSFGFVALWMTLVGAGMGLAMATAASAALADLAEEHSGIGSAVLQATNKIGGPLGSAILGSALTSGYLAHLRLGGLPNAAAHAARQSVFAGVAIARRAGSSTLLHNVQGAFLRGMDLALILSAGIAVLGIALTLAFLPARADGATHEGNTEQAGALRSVG